MTIVLTVIHIIVSLFLILVVLAQQGKGQDDAGWRGSPGMKEGNGYQGQAGQGI